MPYLPNIPNTLRKPLSNERVRLNRSHPLNQGLVAWWPFVENNAHVADVVSGIRGTAAGNPIIGSYIHPIFGLGSYYSTPGVRYLDTGIGASTSSPIQYTNETLTISFTVNIITAPSAGAGRTILKHGNGSFGWNVGLGNKSDDSITNSLFLQTVGTVAWGPSEIIQYGVAQQHTITYDKVNVSYYVDGSFVGATAWTDSITAYSANVTIGTQSSGILGVCYDLSFWAHVLSSERILQLAKYPYGTPSNPRLI